jgi:predicted DNA-binding protein (MmcQ/YjbR family)
MATLNGNRDKRHIKTGKEIRSMNIEQVREYALSLYGVTEDQPFGDDNITFRLEGKIFMCLSLGGNEYDIKDSEPRLALKLSPDRNDELRTQFSAVTPAYHWNKKHWSDVYYNQLEDTQVMEWIKESYQLVASKLQKAVRHKYI